MLLSPKKGINQGLVGGFWYWIFHQLHLRAPGSKGKEKTTNKHKKNSRERLSRKSLVRDENYHKKSNFVKKTKFQEGRNK